MADLERVKKHKNYLFANKGTPDAPKWIRVKTATDFAIKFNAETETFDYISDESPTDEIKSYKPTIGQSQTAFINDFIFDYIFGYAFEQKVGASAVTEGMVVFQQKDESGLKNLAWKFEMAVTIDTYDLVAGTITYTLGTRGNIFKGTAVIDPQGEPVFENA